jgi:hypothetical protein
MLQHTIAHRKMSPGRMSPRPTPDTWLSQFPEKRRSLLANLFYGAVRLGLTEPMVIVTHVMHECHKRRQGSADQAEREHWTHVLQVLRENPAAVQGYAQTVLANEQMPRAQREQQKAAARKGHILRAMEGKPASPKQHVLLRSLGYEGVLPADRAEASTLIDHLLTEKHKTLFDTFGA